MNVPLPLACPGWKTFWHKLFAVFWQKKTLIQAIISDQTTCIIPVYWPIFYFLSLPLLTFYFFLFFSHFAFASLFISPSHPFLYSHPSFPPSFILPRHPLHVLMGVLLTPLSSTSSSHINQPTLPSKPPSMTPLLPPAPLHDPPPPSLSGGKNKNHHSSYLPPFWIDLSISTSAPLRLFYLSTCLTLLVALLSL